MADGDRDVNDIGREDPLTANGRVDGRERRVVDMDDALGVARGAGRHGNLERCEACIPLDGGVGRGPLGVGEPVLDADRAGGRLAAANDHGEGRALEGTETALDDLRPVGVLPRRRGREPESRPDQCQRSDGFTQAPVDGTEGEHDTRGLRSDGQPDELAPVRQLREDDVAPADPRTSQRLRVAEALGPEVPIVILSVVVGNGEPGWIGPRRLTDSRPERRLPPPAARLPRAPRAARQALETCKP